MAKVILKRHLAGIEGGPGTEISISDERAKIWVMEGYADYAEKPKEQAKIEVQRAKEFEKRISEKAVQKPKAETATGVK